MPDVDCCDDTEDGEEKFKFCCCVVSVFPVLSGDAGVAGIPSLSGSNFSFSDFFTALPIIPGDSDGELQATFFLPPRLVRRLRDIL